MRFYYISISLLLILIFYSFSLSLNEYSDGTYNTCKDCNVIIITLDTTRYDHVTAQTAPNIEKLSSKGIVLTNAFSQIPHTPPSHWSMFSGLYPYKHGQFGPRDNGTGITTLTDVLEKNGYLTAGFISSHMVRGFSYRFEVFNGMRGNFRHDGATVKRSDFTINSSKQWLSDNVDKKFFLWVHLFDPHSPYDPPEGYDIYDYNRTSKYSDERYSLRGVSGVVPIREDIANYDGEIDFMDEQIGLLIDSIKENNIHDKTLIVIAGDHGECFGEHNFSDFGYVENEPCIFHGKTLYDEELHVPFIISNPNSSITGRFEHMTELVDIFPTVLETLGVEHPETDGESLFGTFNGNDRLKEHVFSQTRQIRGKFAVSIRDSKWKFIRASVSESNIQKEIEEQEGKSVTFNISDDVDVKTFLFNTDSGEMSNMIDSYKDTANSLDNKLEDVVYSENQITDAESERILRSFGYIS